MDLKDFKEYELYPAIAGDPTRAFPQLHFEPYRGKGWKSAYHIDGTRDSNGAESTILYSNSHTVIDFARGNKPFIDLYMNLNGKDFKTAVEELADLYGLHLPDYDPQKEEEYRRTQDSREKALAIFKEALWSGSPEAEATLQYLRGRGWDDGLIRAAGLGLITTELINSLPEEDRKAYRIKERKNVDGVETTIGEVGVTHTLAIPYRSGSSLLGFTFRRIFDRDKNGQKYLNSLGLRKSGLLNIGVGVSDVVIVEGYLDALHAQALGRTDVVAWTQAKPQSNMIEDALKRGVERFTLLLDMDKTGRESIIPAINAIHRYGGAKAIYVASIPDGEGKDLDEYLTRHTIGEFERVILHEALPYALFVLETIKDKYRAKAEEDGLSFKDRADFFGEVERLINSPYTVPMDREIIREEVRKEEEPLQFRMEDFNEYLDKANEREQQQQLKKQTEAALGEATGLLKDGKVKEAIGRMEEAVGSLKGLSDEALFGDLLRKSTREERLKKFREKPEALETCYQVTDALGQDKPDPLPLKIPSGALTIIAAPTSHGKSALLRNLCLDIARRYQDGSCLYFTFEESEADVIAQFTNTAIDKRLHYPGKHSQVETIANYFATGSTDFIGGSYAEITAEEFKRLEMDFSESCLDTDRIKIYFREYNLETLVRAMEYAVKNIPTKAVFVDYIQILKSEQYSKQPRQDQLKNVCIALKDFSVKTKLPVILAGQLTREARTPFRMDNSQMAESSEIEKAANTIICLWNSAFKPTAYGSKSFSEDEQKEIDALSKRGFNLGTPGKIFAKITKHRGFRGVGMYALFDFHGYSGRIVPNYDPDKEEKEEPGWLKRAIEEEDDKDIF